jgi:ubiquinone/menaquinone biosynthesis C-methylase UbiE
LPLLENKPEDLKILDCGAGEGSVIRYVEKSPFCSKIYGLEISDSAIELAKKHIYEKLVDFKKFDGYYIDYADDFFDIAYCTHVIEHVEHPRVLLRELKRVSKYQIFEVPINYKFYIEKQYDLELSVGRINVYSPALFRFFLKTEEFVIEKEKCSAQTLEWYKETEKSVNAKIMQKLANRTKWLIRGGLNLPLIRYLTDGMGYTSITVLTR